MSSASHASHSGRASRPLLLHSQGSSSSSRDGSSSGTRTIVSQSHLRRRPSFLQPHYNRNSSTELQSNRARPVIRRPKPIKPSQPRNRTSMVKTRPIQAKQRKLRRLSFIMLVIVFCLAAICVFFSKFNLGSELSRRMPAAFGAIIQPLSAAYSRLVDNLAMSDIGIPSPSLRMVSSTLSQVHSINIYVRKSIIELLTNLESYLARYIKINTSALFAAWDRLEEVFLEFYLYVEGRVRLFVSLL